MEKWSFNMLLFSNLTEVLDISGAEIARRSGMKQPVLNRYMNGEIVLPVQILIQICNALRMPAHYFVSEYNKHEIPNRESATIPLDYWRPIDWDRNAVELTFGDGEGRIYWKDVAVVMNVSSQKPHERFLLRKRFPVNDFLNTCNALNKSPFLFLVDPNWNSSRAKVRKTSGPAGNNERLLVDVRELTNKLADMNAAVSDITAKYDDLLRRHTALLDRHNELERKFNDFVGYDRPLMAADHEDV